MMIRKILLLPLVLPAMLLASVWELGAGGGMVVFDRQSSGGYLESGDESFARFWVRGGYQLTGRSDQWAVALSSDKRIDELDLIYNLMLHPLEPYAPFGALPYGKLALGIGNTHADTGTLTHLSGAAGIGLLGRSNQTVRIRFELEYRMREGQLERSGEGRHEDPVSWRDSELNFLLGFGLIF